MSWEIRQADCIAAMRELDESSIDALVCDPPYGLEFMGKEWDKFDARATGGFRAGGLGTNVAGRVGPTYEAGLAAQKWHHAWATEALRVLKPGGHLLAFGGTRTYHRLACAVEDAGFEIRDSVIWLYGSGFPKSLDVSKAIDRVGGREGLEAQQMARELIEVSGLSNAEIASRIGVDSRLVQFWRDGEQRIERDKFERLREVVEGLKEHPPEGGREYLGDNPNRRTSRSSIVNVQTEVATLTAPATPEAQQWQGWGTALKPAHEPIVVARKPLVGTVAQNVQKHGTGALNVDGCRVGGPPRTTHANGHRSTGSGAGYGMDAYEAEVPSGRWPANVVLDEESAALLDAQTGERAGPGGPARSGSATAWPGGDFQGTIYPGETGGPSRFFYTAKASRSERNAGLEGFEERQSSKLGGGLRSSTGPAAEADPRIPAEGTTSSEDRQAANHHPTVKPIALMRWLCRLVTPPNGLILDPFTGSGTTGCAAVLEGFDFLGIEREAEYVEIAKARLAYWSDPKAHDARVAEARRLEDEAQAIEEGRPVQLGFEAA